MRGKEASPAYGNREALNWPKMTMPLSYVPERRTGISSDLLNTAGHELNHALVAIACGASVVSVSVRREGDSLGRTMFAGSVSTDTMKVIAAAGSVAAHDGCAHGFGSDMHHVDLLSHFHGGISKESAITQAESLISKHPIEVRGKAAEIVAYLGEISGSMMPAILARAQMEFNLEKGILGNLFVPEQKFDFEKTKPKAKDYTVIDNLGGGSYRITYVIGERKREELICGACNDTNSHYKDCPKSKIAEHEIESPSNHYKLPKAGIIFSRN